MPQDNVGEYDRIVARREHIADRLSPAARHHNLPTLYAKPMPFPSTEDAAREEIKVLTRKNAALRDEVFRLKAQIDALKSVPPPEPGAARPGTVASVMDLAAEVTGVSVEAMRGPIRARSRAVPRHFAIWLVHQVRWDLTNSQIGYQFGDRDPTTVLHALNNVAKFRDTSPFAGWMADPRIQDALTRKRGAA